ncbi:MAG: aminoacyl-tRNA hydrolase [Candidatus Celaenobacter antarcticus]|nr:aminoacyl-tRNA hydrolase [Candidatus Celaenobacter antarcticus]
MKLIVGLGNPGPEYESTRHNIGFMILDAVCRKLKVPPFKKFKKYLLARKDEWLFLKALTYMNLSGQAVSSVMKEFDIKKSDLLIILDDVHIPLGKIRIRRRGSDAGHNGLKSVIELLESENFPRMRIGILPEIHESASELTMPLEEFVLMNFLEEENKRVQEILPTAVELTSYFIYQNYEKMSAAFSRLCSLSVE